MKKYELKSSEEAIEIIHKPLEFKMNVKCWLEIQLALCKRKESVEQWLDEMDCSFQLYKKVCDLNEIELIELQILCASLKTPCVIVDDYDRYTMEEIMRINRILKKIAAKKEVKVIAEDERIIYQQSDKVPLVKISMSCKNFEAQKYMKFAEVLQEGDNLICYFEEVYYVKMENCNDKDNH